MINEKQEELNIYSLNIKEKLDKFKIIFIVLIIIAIICIYFVVQNITKTITAAKICKQYETQLNAIIHQQEEKKRIAEKKKQEKLPKLTEVRKTKHGKNI